MGLGFVASLSLRGSCATNLLRSRARSSTCFRRARVVAPRASMSGISTSTEAQGPNMVRARHILVDSEEMVDAVKQQIDDGKGTFAELAGLVSTCTSKGRGGDLGWFQKNTMVKEFENAAFSNPPGSVVKVQSEFGWHLIKVEGHGIAAAPISVTDFEKRFGKGGSENVSNVQLIDCRERNELEVASLEGFLNLPMGEFGSWADDFENGTLKLDKEKETIVMCHHGIRSANFCSFLSQQGFTNVRNLTGGIHAYATKVDSSVPLY